VAYTDILFEKKTCNQREYEESSVKIFWSDKKQATLELSTQKN